MTDTVSRLALSLSDRYRIERELGQGGMATVYLAHDVRHDRKVALKVLRPELAAILGGERFLAEIKTTANLQHPHILPLHDSGEADGLVFYVMPYIEGESIRDRLTREKQLPVEDAVRIAREVASALDYAHRHNVVHRDIKPENILLHDGQALVADFGIALAASRSEGGTRMTETGMSLGTPHYMAPEQAMGEREITPKADIYALGCVLYEMLTGEPPFTGPTAQAIIARVMMEEPRSLTLQRHTIPPHIEAVVRKALEKLPADRFATAAEFGSALDKTGFSVAATRAGTAARSAATARAGALQWAPWVALAVVAVAGAWGTWRPRPAPPPSPVTRFNQAFEREGRVLDAAGSPIAVSPDGSRIAYLGRDSAGSRWIYVRALDRAEPVQVAGTREALQPFFSPDGNYLGFLQDGRLRKVALAGGAVVTLLETSLSGASWGAGDVIVYASEGRLFKVSAAGGRPDTVASPDTGFYRWPDLLPDGRTVVFTAGLRGAPPVLAMLTLGDTTVHLLDQAGVSPRWVEGGFLSFVQTDGTLFGAPFDPARRRFTGEPQPIAEGVRIGPASVAKMGVARNGTLAYLGGTVGEREIVVAERGRQPVPLALPLRFYYRPRFSPDGRRIAVSQFWGSIAVADVWVFELQSGNATRLTFDSVSISPEWTPDGRRLVYSGGRAGYGNSILRTIAADGSGIPETLLVRQGSIGEVQFAPDGHSLVFREIVPQTLRDIWVARRDSLAAARPLLRTPFNETAIALSPDGRWLAYVSNATGSPEVYVRLLEEGSGNWKVSIGGGAEPRWGAFGGDLLFRRQDTVFAVAMTPGPEPRFGPAQPVLVSRLNNGSDTPSWDVSRDGRRFVFTRDREGTDATSLHVVSHWFDQLRAARGR